MADEMIYETTIANYKSVIGALRKNTPDTPYTVRITDIENLVTDEEAYKASNLGKAINSTSQYVNIIWKDGDVWEGKFTWYMFYNCKGLVRIDTSPFINVTKANDMFNNCSNLTEIDTSSFTNVTDASTMFRGCSELKEIDISPFINATDASDMLKYCTSLTDVYISTKVSSAVKTYIQGLSDVTLHWTIYTTIANYATELKALPKNAEDTAYDVIIEDIKNIQIYEDKWSSNIADAIEAGSRYINLSWGEGIVWSGTNASSMFESSVYLMSIDTSPFVNVTVAKHMFAGCERIPKIDTTPFKKVTDAERMFSNCFNLTEIDTSPFTKVTNAERMFFYCERLSQIDTSSFTNVTNASDMFMLCESLNFIDLSPLLNVTTVDGLLSDTEGLTAYNANDNQVVNDYLATLENVNVIDTIETTIDEYEEKVGLLSDNHSPTSRSHPNDYIHNIKITDPENISYQIKEDTEDKRIWNINIVIQNTARYVNISFLEGSEWAGTDATSLFSTKFLCGIDSSVFKNVSNATEMFSPCINLKKINTVGFRNVINANKMFQVCTALKEIDTSNFINVKDITRMFRGVNLNGFDVSPLVNVEIADEIFLNSRTPIIVSSMEHPFNSAITEYLEGREHIIKFSDDIKFYFPYSYRVYLPESLWEKNVECNIVEDLPKITPLKFYAVNVNSLEANTAENPYPVMITEATDKTSEDFHAGMDGATNYTEVSFEDDVKYIDVRGAKVTGIDLSNLERLEYLDVSETDITELNLRETSLTYCEFDDDHKLIKGWLAQNCKMLKKVTALQKQVQDKNLNLENDTNACIGCDSLQEVEVLCDEEPKYDGFEKHYAKVEFENDVRYKGKLLEEMLKGGSSLPIGSIIMWYSENAPAGWVFCNHTKLPISDYAELYEKLKDIPQCQSEEEGFFYTPDFRESVPVGVGENGTNVISAHDIYTLGEFKDDQFQDHSHYIYSCVNGNLDGGTKGGYQSNTSFDTEARTRNGGGTYTDSKSSLIIARNIIDGYGRHGTTTHGKQLGTNFIIKALNVTESLDESIKVDDNKNTTGNVLSAFKVNSLFTQMYEEYKTHYYKRGIFENTRTSGNEICVDISEVDDEWDNYDHEVLINFGMYEDGSHTCGFYSDICGDYDSSTSTMPASISEFRCGGTTQTRQNNLQMWIPCHRYIYQHFANATESARFNVMAWKRIPKTTD